MLLNEMIMCPVAFAVSRDHKPDQSDERERIENAGGFVMWAGNKKPLFTSSSLSLCIYSPNFTELN